MAISLNYLKVLSEKSWGFFHLFALVVGCKYYNTHELWPALR